MLTRHLFSAIIQHNKGDNYCRKHRAKMNVNPSFRTQSRSPKFSRVTPTISNSWRNIWRPCKSAQCRSGNCASGPRRTPSVPVLSMPLATTKARQWRWSGSETTCLVATPTRAGMEVLVSSVRLALNFALGLDWLSKTFSCDQFLHFHSVSFLFRWKLWLFPYPPPSPHPPPTLLPPPPLVRGGTPPVAQLHLFITRHSLNPRALLHKIKMKRGWTTAGFVCMQLQHRIGGRAV